MLWYLFLELLWKTPPYMGKTLLKSEKNIFQISLKKGPPPDSTFWNICNCLLNSFRAKKLLCYIWFGYIDLWASEQNVRLEWNGCSGPDSIQWIPFRLSRLVEHLRCWKEELRHLLKNISLKMATHRNGRCLFTVRPCCFTPTGELTNAPLMLLFVISLLIDSLLNTTSSRMYTWFHVFQAAVPSIELRWESTILGKTGRRHCVQILSHHQRLKRPVGR